MIKSHKKSQLKPISDIIWNDSYASEIEKCLSSLGLHLENDDQSCVA